MDVEPAGGDGFSYEPPRAFATGYRAHSGDMMVYGGGVVTLVGVIATFVNGNPAFLVASLAGSLSSLYFWPTVDVRQPQLGANSDGIYVARIGVIGWPSVETMVVQRRALRTMNLATLFVTLNRPLSDALLVPEEVPLSMRYTARNARVSGKTVRVELHTLAMPVDAIETRLRALRRSSGGATG